MNENTAKEILSELRLISRTLAFLCIATGPCANRPLGVQARALKSIGYGNSEIAALLNSTPNSIGVRLAETKSWRSAFAKEED
jgi:hypothetical protein